MTNKKDFPVEETSQLLKPGYQPIETGYYRLPNGHMHVRVLTRMPRCQGKMVDWWFGYLRDTETYKIWHPRAHLMLEWDSHWKPGHYIGASHTVEELVGGQLLKARIQFHDPAEFFDTSRFKAAKVGAVICANVYDLEEAPHGRLIHFVRDTDSGCEMRSRFWLFQAPDVAGLGLMVHCIEEMGNLADFLPELYAEENAGK
jgi:hypothetical protein